MPRVMILDDREAYLRALRVALRQEFDIATAATVRTAQEALAQAADICLVDVRLSETDRDNREGLTFLAWARDRFPDLAILMMSAYRDIDAAVTALDLGADWFLAKPIDLAELKSLLREFAANGRMPEKTIQLRERLPLER